MNKTEADKLGLIVSKLNYGEGSNEITRSIARDIAAVSSKIVEVANDYMEVVTLYQTERVVMAEMIRRRGHEHLGTCPLDEWQEVENQIKDGWWLFDCHCILIGDLGINGYMDWLDDSNRLSAPAWRNAVSKSKADWIPVGD